MSVTLKELEQRTRHLSVLLCGIPEPIKDQPKERTLQLKTGSRLIINEGYVPNYSVQQYVRGKFKTLLFAFTKRELLHQINGAIRVKETNP